MDADERRRSVGTVEVDLNVTPGPVLRTALDVLEYCDEVLTVVPRELKQRRTELQSRGQALVDIIRQELRVKVGKGKDEHGSEK